MNLTIKNERSQKQKDKQERQSKEADSSHTLAFNHCRSTESEQDPQILSTFQRNYPVRKVRINGTILLDDVPYYIKGSLAGQYVNVCVNATRQLIEVEHHGQMLKQLPVKGLKRTVLPCATFVEAMAQEALSEYRRVSASTAEKQGASGLEPIVLGREKWMRGGFVFSARCGGEEQNSISFPQRCGRLFLPACSITPQKTGSVMRIESHTHQTTLLSDAWLWKCRASRSRQPGI